MVGEHVPAPAHPRFVIPSGPWKGTPIEEADDATLRDAVERLDTALRLDAVGDPRDPQTRRAASKNPTADHATRDAVLAELRRRGQGVAS